MDSISLHPKGTSLTRVAIALCRSTGKEFQAADTARMLWGEYSTPAKILKAAVTAGSLVPGATWDASALSDYSTASAEFFGAVKPMTIVGRLSGIRRVPFNTRILGADAGATAFWVGAGRPKPLTKLSLTGSQLVPLKMATVVVLTTELVENAHQDAEALVRNELTTSIADLLDVTFIDATNAGTANESPASITNGLTPISATADPAADIAALIGDFQGDLSAAYFVTDPLLAAQIGLSRDAAGSFQFPDSGPRGGSVAGIPLLVSRSSPRVTAGGQLVLVDPTGIAFGDQGVFFDKASQATVEMLDNPTNTSVTATATTQVSLWQNNAVGIKGVLFANWSVGRPSVSVLVDASY